ncbi:family 43 glycosylhydrolase [Natronoflexus pectinivorans]|nr:family 43 glycosylhydrolase [Natronoflexus pectinivorans]
MKKRVIIVSMALLMFFQLTSQNRNLKLHYDFKSVSPSGEILDVSGNGFNAELKNEAFLDHMGDYHILNLGFHNGYLDMGEQTGELVNSLKDFSVSTYVYVDEGVSLSLHGSFILTFSNSTDIRSEGNGCLFLSARDQTYAITKTDSRGEQAVRVGEPVQQGAWMHIVYTQEGNQGNLFIDGKMVASNTVDIYPSAIGKTKFNFIGRSPYKEDNYLRGLLADFRIYDKALTVREINRLGRETKGLAEAHVEYAQRPIRLIANGNPLFSHKYTADPAALVHDDVFYIYAGQDVGDGRGYNMPNWVVFSSEDLETWYEHPIPLRPSDFSWARGNYAWAAQVIERDGKFYWYVSTQHYTGARAIGVAVSDSPTGPFVDAIGSALITNDMTTHCTNITWDDIDPTVWIDDDGQAYLFWGNTCCYYVKLKDNMIEMDGDIMTIEDLPHFTEAPWIHKKNDWYYLSYAAWFPEKTAYARSKSINGPWEYMGILNEVAGNSNTNHQAIVEFKGQWYFVYHNGALPTQGGSYLRSVCIDYLHHNEDGSIQRVIMTTEGVSPVRD